jgi:hypothetical protein
MVANQGPGPPYFPGGLYVLNLSTNVQTAVPNMLRVMDNWPR